MLCDRTNDGWRGNRSDSSHLFRRCFQKIVRIARHLQFRPFVPCFHVNVMNFQFDRIVQIVFTRSWTGLASKIGAFARIFAEMNAVVQLRRIDFDCRRWTVEGRTNRWISGRRLLRNERASFIFFETVGKFRIGNRWWQ